jgi:hypothetical protein
MNLSVSTGIQRDNLDRTKVSTMRRMVGSLNVNYTPSQRLNISGSYSSFQTFTNIRSQFESINQLTPYDNRDTLNFTQISRNGSLSGIYSLSATAQRRQQLNFQLSCQQAADQQGGVQQNGTRFYNLIVGYGMNLVPQNTNLAISFNVTRNRGPFMQTQMIGPTASVSRVFFERRFRTTFSASYNETHSKDIKTQNVLSARWSGVFTIRNRHNLNISAVMVKRSVTGEHAGRSFAEFTGTVGYNYSFAWHPVSGKTTERQTP